MTPAARVPCERVRDRFKGFHIYLTGYESVVVRMNRFLFSLCSVPGGNPGTNCTKHNHMLLFLHTRDTNGNSLETQTHIFLFSWSLTTPAFTFLSFSFFFWVYLSTAVLWGLKMCCRFRPVSPEVSTMRDDALRDICVSLNPFQTVVPHSWRILRYNNTAPVALSSHGREQFE